MMKRAMIAFGVMIIVCLSISACKKKPAVKVIARGAPIKGANGLYFDKHDRLHIGSVFGREIVVMDPDSGKILDRIGPDRGVDTPDDVTFGPDGSLCWTAIMTGEVGRLTPDGKKVAVAQQLVGANPIAFSQDGRLFVALDFLGKGLYELDPSGAKLPRPIDEQLVDFNAFDFGPDGKLYGPLVSAGKIISVDVDSGAKRIVAEGFKVPSAVKFDMQGRLFALDQTQGKVFLVNPANGQKVEYASLEPGLDNLAFDSRGRLFVSNANTGAIYEVRADRNVRIVSPGGMTCVDGIAVLPRSNGESIYVPTGFGIVEFDGQTGKQRGFVQALLHSSPLQIPITLAANGSKLVTSSLYANVVQIWDPATTNIIQTFTGVASPTNAISFQGDIVAAELGTNPPRVVRISMANPATRTTLAELKVPIGLAATAQDLWASDRAAGTVVQIIKEGQQLKQPSVVASGLKGPEGMAVAPDGSLLVVESQAGKLSRIDLRSGMVSSVAEKLELGSPGPAALPTWNFDGVAVGPSGAIYIGGDKANVIYRIQ
jgi:sugar lactone lactonase YvrE